MDNSKVNNNQTLSSEHNDIVSIAEQFVSLIDSGDIETLFTLFADNISVEDPVGINQLQGREAVETFIREGRPAAGTSIRFSGPVCTTTNNEAALPLKAEMTFDGQRFSANMITTIKLDADQLISEFRAFWNPEQMEKTV